MKTLLTKTLRALSAVVICLTLLAYICPWVSPATFRWLAFFGTAFPWFLLANLVLAVVWLWRRSRFGLYHVAILIFGWPYVTGFIGFDTAKDTVPESAFVVATHNLGTLFRGKKMSDALREKTAADYVRFLEENGDPDILCIQETGGKFYRLVADKMGYPYNFNLKKGTVILSRYPMEGGGEVPFGKTANSSLWVDMRVQGQLVRIYNVHMQSNKVTSDTEKVIGEAELDEGATWKEIGSVLDRVGSATSLRAEQANRLRDHIAACPHPVLVCGDFNDTPNSYVYATLARGLSDTFREKGLGLGTTFAGVLPLLRIDYILTDPAFTTFSCRTVRNDDFSDHFPVFVAMGK